MAPNQATATMRAQTLARCSARRLFVPVLPHDGRQPRRFFGLGNGVWLTLHHRWLPSSVEGFQDLWEQRSQHNIPSRALAGLSSRVGAFVGCDFDTCQVAFRDQTHATRSHFQVGDRAWNVPPPPLATLTWGAPRTVRVLERAVEGGGARPAVWESEMSDGDLLVGWGRFSEVFDPPASAAWGGGRHLTMTFLAAEDYYDAQASPSFQLSSAHACATQAACHAHAAR